MKSITMLVVTAILMATTAQAQTQSEATLEQSSVQFVEVDKAAKTAELTERLIQIKGMNYSEVSYDEKKQLSKEVKAIKRSLHEMGGGVYISVGGIIIILLLLIILF